MKFGFVKPLCAAAALAAGMWLDAPASQAQGYGNAPWCAVISLGTGDVQWQCEYRTVEECVPNVLAGNRGSCTQNPSFHGWAAAPPVVHHRYRKHHART
jgi:hypothetical protein